MAIEAPGCFGLPCAVSSESESCRACPVKGKCAKQAYQLLESLPDKALIMREKQALGLTIKGLLERSEISPDRLHYSVIKTTRYGLKRAVLTAEQEKYLQALPRKVGQQTKQLMEKGWFDFAKEELASGKNPSLKGWKKVICEQLINEGKTSRAMVAQALEGELGLCKDSAKIQTSIGIAIFVAGGLLRASKKGELELNLF